MVREDSKCTMIERLIEMDAWRLHHSFICRIGHTLVVLLVVCLSFSFGWADEINEFDNGTNGWTAYPSTMGRGSEAGWVNVTNDGEGSIRNNPTGTRYVYYWKLTRDIDLSNLDSPSLEVKYHFKGHNYDHFRIQVGQERARRLSDFTVIHEAAEASTDPTEVSLDLGAYAGQKIRIQFLLRKPHDVVERRSGIYVHRAAIVTPINPGNFEEQPGELMVSAFNIQVFGRSKMAKPSVVEALIQIITRFDLVMIQEVRDLSEIAIVELLDAINEVSPHPYELILSERLGRTSSKEQFAYLYRSDKLRFINAETVEDPMDLYERPPVWARFEFRESASPINILGSHLSSDAVSTEIEALYNEFARYHLGSAEDESVIVMGDFSAGCHHLNDHELSMTTLFQNENLNCEHLWSHPRGPPGTPERPKPIPAQPGQDQISGDLEIWGFWNPTNPKI